MNNGITSLIATLLIAPVDTHSVCENAIAVTGEAAGVANANSEIINNKQTIPIGSIPIDVPKLTRIGMHNTVTSILFAMFVKIVAKIITTIINTIGGKAINGLNR